MTKEEIIKKTEKFVKDKLSGGESGHDWWHTYRVWQMAKKIGKKEKANMFVVELGALLHDIADWKFQDKRETSVGAMVAKEWLENLGVTLGIVSCVSEIVAGVSFKGENEKDRLKSIEGRVVQDADRLDAIGAIGIARAFTYGGGKRRLLHNPKAKPRKNLIFKDYKKGSQTTLNHFYEKLLLLKDRMHTKTGKRWAEKRHQFMEDYLNQFFAEWEGKD